MLNQAQDKSSDDSESYSVKLYSRKTSESWLDEDEERESWHEEFPDFVFLKQLSTTQSSTVWMVEDTRDGKVYGAKIIPRIENDNVRKLHQENQLEFLQKVHLEHAVKTFQIQSSQDFYLILMEYLKQGDLASYTQNYAQNMMHKYSQQHLNWVKFCFSQIVNCVDQLHERGFVHRDLKPDNFMIWKESSSEKGKGKLKINDFGLVIKENSVDSVFCGTPSYMAPQRLDSKKSKLPITTSSDMWSLGIILYQLLTGQVPYQQNDKDQLLQLIYTNFIWFQEQVPCQLKSLIQELLQINPSKRMTMQRLKQHSFVRNG